jgi:hypothetical protein
VEEAQEKGGDVDEKNQVDPEIRGPLWVACLLNVTCWVSSNPVDRVLLWWIYKELSFKIVSDIHIVNIGELIVELWFSIYQDPFLFVNMRDMIDFFNNLGIWKYDLVAFVS